MNSPSNPSWHKRYLPRLREHAATPLLFFAIAWACCAQPAVPDTPVGKVFTEWLETFNSGDRAKMLSFMKVHEPERVASLDRRLNQRERTGGFILLRIEAAGPRKLKAALKERKSDYVAELQMAVNEADPPVVTEFWIVIGPPKEDRDGPGRLTETEAIAGVEREAARRSANGEFSGALLVARRGRILTERAYGLADREQKIPATIDTRYRIGSMNKMFTAIAALQLVEAGKLSLDKPVGEYLPNYQNKGVSSKVTLRHLLSHTGGTGDIFGPEYEKNRQRLRTLNDYVSLYGGRDLRFEPGAKWEYSNYGFVLAGVLIEKASRMSYYDYVREKVFKPAGMTMTDSQPEEERVAKRSVGYRSLQGKWVPNTDILPWRATSAGGGYSTVGDLFRFAQALESGRLIGKAMLNQATSRQNKPTTQSAYGFGFIVRDGWFGHGGGFPGMNGELKIFRESGYVVAVLANLDPPAATSLADWFVIRMPK